MKSLLRLSVLFLLSGFASQTPLPADTLDWTGMTPDFNDPGNWLPSSAFTTGCTLNVNIFAGGGPYVATITTDLNPDVIVGELNIGGQLEMTAGTVNVQDQFLLSGTAATIMNMTGGSLNKVMGGSGDFNVGVDGGNGTLNTSGDAAITQRDRAFYVGCFGGAGAFGKINMNDSSKITITNGEYFDVGDGGSLGRIAMRGYSSFSVASEWTQVGNHTSDGWIDMVDNARFTVMGGHGLRVGTSEDPDGAGGTPTGHVTMSDYSAMTVIDTNMYVGMWNGATGYCDMTGDATLNVVGGSLYVGDGELGDGTRRCRGYMTVTSSSTAVVDVDVYVGTRIASSTSGDPWSSINVSDNGTLRTTNIYVGDNSGVGLFNVDGNGTVIASQNVRVGNVNGAGTMTVTGGLVSVGANMGVGYDAGAGELNMTGGMVDVVGWIDVGCLNAADGTVNMIGGTIVKQNGDPNSYATIGYNGTGVWNQMGGLADLRTGVCIGQNGYQGTLNLYGGTFCTGFVQAGYVLDSAARMTVNFDGGTLKVNTASPYAPSGGSPFVSPGGSSHAELLVKDGGARIDTSGRDCSIMLPLLHAALGPHMPDGGLTKLGGGTLTLTSNNTYFGDTFVAEGGVHLVSTASLLMDVNEMGLDFTQIYGVGATTSATLDGRLNLDINDVLGNSGSWLLVAVDTLDEHYGNDFSLQLTTATTPFGGSTLSGGVFTYVDGARTWQFTESDGILTLTTVPEPSTIVLLFGGLAGLLCYAWRKRR